MKAFETRRWRPKLYSVKYLPVVMFVQLFLCALPLARAQNQADAAYNAWTSNFLVQNGSQAYFASTLTGTGRNSAAYMWGSALDTIVVMDTDDRTHNPSLVPLVTNLSNTFIVNNGSD